MLTKEIIEKNRKDFNGFIKVYNVCTPEFIEFLTDKGLFTAPATTSISMHNAFPGGLVDHILKVAKYAVKINDILPDILKQSKESIIKISLLHSIGKTELFIPNNSEWANKNQGKMYDFNKNLISMSVSERSLYYIMSNNNCNFLNDVEYQAILNCEKDNSDKMCEWFNSTLGDILKMAIKLAIIEEKEINKL